MAGLFINSGVLFSTAQDAVTRALAATKNAKSPGTNDPLVAVIFAAATAEAFINEIGELASHPPIPGQLHPDEVSSCAVELAKVEDSRGTTQEKYLSAKAAFTGETYDKGSQPYQDFSLLFDLRNSLMHLKFDRIKSVKVNEADVQHPPVIERLRSKNVLAACDSDTITSWVTLICTPAVAEWACNACVAMVRSLLSCIPESYLKQQVNVLYKWSSLEANAI